MTSQLSKEAPSKEMTNQYYWERLEDGCPSLVDLAFLGNCILVRDIIICLIKLIF